MHDVAIIGAGVHGASAAFHLAQRGVRTVVVDGRPPAGGPTGRSSAVCRGYYTNDFLASVAREAIGIFEQFTELTGGDAGYRRTGALFLHPPEDEPQLRLTAARLNAAGTATEVLDRSQIATVAPMLDVEGIGWGVWEEAAGYADPAGTTVGLLTSAVAAGATFRGGSSVRRIEHGEGVRLHLTDGTALRAHRLLIAAGPWTAQLAAQIGVDLPLHAERHIVATLGWGAAPPVPFVFADLPGGYYCKPEGTEQCFLGPLHQEPPCDPDDFAEHIADAEVGALVEAVVHRVPAMEASMPTGGWASLYDVSPDWQPVIGQIAEAVFVDAGTSGHGFKLAPALGRHVADLLTGGQVDPGLAQFHPSRFQQGTALDGGYGAARILG